MSKFLETDPSFDAENPSFDSPPSNSNDDSAMNAYAAYQDPEEDQHKVGEQPKEAVPEAAETDINQTLTQRSFDEDTSYKSMGTHESNGLVSPSLQAMNIANIVSYIANAAVVFVVGSTNVSELPTNAEISALYPTLMTPAGYAFSIWGLIFIAQFIWSIAQLLPTYRASPIVIQTVGWKYVWICIAQITWTGFFITEQILFSLFAMIALVIPLVMILKRVTETKTEDPLLPTKNEPVSAVATDMTTYFLLQFPFEIHAAWIIAAAIVNANVLVVDLDLSKTIQVVAAIISVAILAVTGTVYTIRGRYAVPAVIGWASLGIAIELSDPFNVAMVEHYPSSAVSGIEFATGGLAAFLWMFIMAKVVVDRQNASATNTSEESDDEDDFEKISAEDYKAM